VCEKYPEEIGIDREQSEKLQKVREKQRVADEAKAAASGEQQDAPVIDKSLVRMGGRPTTSAAPAASTSAKAYDPSEDPISPLKLDVEGIVRSEGIAMYKDQAGRLWTGLATYWIKQQEFDLAKSTFEEGITTVLTLRDFTQIFDAYAEFSESYISSLMDGLADGDEEDAEADEKEMDDCMKSFEELMDRRPFLVNDVLLRRNPNDVQEWEKRVALHGTDDEKVRSLLFSSRET
jgi:pre-mRNA-splicing factor SYF1